MIATNSEILSTLKWFKHRQITKIYNDAENAVAQALLNDFLPFDSKLSFIENALANLSTARIEAYNLFDSLESKYK